MWTGATLHVECAPSCSLPRSDSRLPHATHIPPHHTLPPAALLLLAGRCCTWGGSSTGARPPPSEWIGVLHERGLPAQPASGETSGSKWQGDDEWCKGMHDANGTGGSKAVTRTHQPILPTLWCLLLSLCPAADRWKDTGNRMQAKELKPLVGILILFLCLAAPALRWKDTGSHASQGAWGVVDGVCAAGERPPLAQPIRYQPIPLVAPPNTH
ncbi:unnamed protein product, partial [Closterium sp. NIES-64]